VGGNGEPEERREETVQGEGGRRSALKGAKKLRNVVQQGRGGVVPRCWDKGKENCGGGREKKSLVVAGGVPLKKKKKTAKKKVRRDSKNMARQKKCNSKTLRGLHLARGGSGKEKARRLKGQTPTA